MTNEPQNQGEQWLKAYAQRRDSEAAQTKVELHPATRRMLQAEVARTYAPPAAAPIESAGLFGRWAFNALALAAVGVVAAVLGVIISDTQRTKPTQFAGSPKPVDGDIEKVDAALKLNQSSETESVLTWTLPTRKEAGQPALANAGAASAPTAKAPIALTAQPPSLDGVGHGSAEAVPTPAAAKAVVLSAEGALPPSPANSDSPSGGKVRLTSRSAIRSATGEPTPVISDKLNKTPMAAAASVAVKEKERIAKDLPPTDAINEAAKNLMVAKKAEVSASATSVAPAATTPGVAGNVLSGKLNRGVSDSQNTSYLQQNFSQSDGREQQGYRRNLNAPGESRVLVNFQLEREGDSVRVMDGDGSVYLGNVLIGTDRKASPAKGQKESKEELVKREEPKRDRAAQLDQEKSKVSAESFSFQVIGTNRSVRQRVVFDGTYQMPVLEPKGGPSKGAAENKNAPGNLNPLNLNDPKQQSQQSQMGAPRVQGRAVIGGNRIEVDAVPVSK